MRLFYWMDENEAYRSLFATNFKFKIIPNDHKFTNVNHKFDAYKKRLMIK